MVQVRHGLDQGREVIERSGHTATGHAGPAVLTHRHVEAGVGESLRLRAGVSAVVGGAPEAAVHDEHRGADRLPIAAGEAQVVDLSRVATVGARRVGRGRRAAEHLVAVGARVRVVSGEAGVRGGVCMRVARHALHRGSRRSLW